MRGVIVLLLLISQPSLAQKYSLEKSKVVFFSDAAIEDIRAENTKTVSIYNTETGEVAFSIPIKEFQFENATMQEHFNEKYLDTEKFPKATFQGKFSSFNQDGDQPQTVTAVGKLTIHGVTREVEITGTIQIASQKILAKATFMVKLADYNIKIPQLLWQKIAEQVEVIAEFTYKPQ
ncbi:MAG TPA: YceI family protein [Cytophagales bacterium]|nr:YceI family protein [Cytophagales bacterium]HRG10861.1 YceI family protein [Cyclobacteriaceae bacterium]